MKSRDFLFRTPYVFLLIVAAIFVVYAQILTFSLGKLDEYNILIVNMDLLRDFSNLKEILLTNPFFHQGGEFYRPIQNLSFMIDAHLSGDAGWGFYLTNIVIHAATCSLLWYLLILLGSEKRIALLMTLLYAMHPLFVQTVAWSPSRGDMLITLFGLISFIAFLKYVRTGKGWFLLIHVLAYALALFSKESAVLIPVLCYGWLFLFKEERRVSVKGLIAPGVFYLLFIAMFFYIRNEIVKISVPDNQIGILVMLRNARTLPELLFKFFIPVGLTPMPAFGRGSTIAGLVIIGLLAWMSIRSKPASFRLFLFGMAWFLLFTAPALVYVNKYGSASCDYMEHRGYLPSVGLLIFLALWLSGRSGLKAYKYVPAFLLVLTGIFGIYTGLYAGTYKDSVTYFDRAVKKNPASAVAWYCRGTTRFLEREDYPGALSDFETALKLYPAFGQAYLNRGYCKEQLNDNEGAILDYRMAAKVAPETYEPHAALAFLFYNLGDKGLAAGQYDTAILLNPGFSVGYYHRGLLKMSVGDNSGALADLDQAIRIDPRYAEAYLYRGVIRSQGQEAEAAMDDFNEAVRLNNHLTEAYINRGVLKFQLQDFPAAMADLDKAIETDPRSADAYLNRGRILYILKESDRARSDWEMAAQLGSKDASGLLQNYFTESR